jgi:hypothetical protein
MTQAEDFLLVITGNESGFGVQFPPIRSHHKPSRNVDPGYRSGHIYEWYRIAGKEKYAGTLWI